VSRATNAYLLVRSVIIPVTI